MTSPSDPIRFSLPTRAETQKKRQTKGLGKGLGALMGETRREEPLVRIGAKPDGSTGMAMLPVANIAPHPDQPRRTFNDAALDELAASIAQRGVIQPIVVRSLKGYGEGKLGRYQLVAGERRWRAAKRAKLTEIPALVRDLDDGEVAAIALIENIQREDLNPVEEARAYQRLARVEDMTQAEIARLVDKSRSHVANTQRLLALPDAVLEMVIDGSLAAGHARALVGHDNAAALARKAVAEGLSARAVETLAKDGAAKTPVADKSRQLSGNRAKNEDIAAVERHLEECLGMPVAIKADANPRTGTVTIRYRTLDQLDLVCQRLTGDDI
ncbi:MAG: ParB/RepB/Spo0J family partition protein [Parerythrobacter sp.]